MRVDNFTKNNIIMFVSNGLSSFLNLIYQLVMLRLLSRDIFASLSSLLSLFGIISVPAMAFTIMVTKYVSSNNARNESRQLKAVWQRLFIHSFLFSLGVLAVVAIFSSSITNFLQINSVTSVIILGGILFVSGITPIINGGLQGLEKFKWLAAFSVLAGVLRLAVSAGFLRFMPRAPLDAVLLGFLVSGLVCTAASLGPLSFLLKTKARDEDVDLRQPYLYVLPTFIVSLCAALLTNIDMVLVKHFFLTEAQDYSVAQLIGKIVLFIPGMIYMVMFSRASNLYASRQGSRDILKRSVLFAFGLCLFAVVLYNLFPQLIMRIMAGPFNSNSIMLGRFFSFAMFFCALNNILLYYQLSVESYDFIKPLILMTALQITAIGIFHKTALWVIVAVLINSMVIFILNLRSAFKASSIGE